MGISAASWEIAAITSLSEAAGSTLKSCVVMVQARLLENIWCVEGCHQPRDPEHHEDGEVEQTGVQVKLSNPRVHRS